MLPGLGGLPLPLPPKDSFGPQAPALPQLPGFPQAPAFPQPAQPQFPAAPGADSFGPAAQQQAGGAPQQAGPTPGPEGAGAAGPEGFSDKNPALANGGGSKLMSPAGIATAAVLGLGAIYTGKYFYQTAEHFSWSPFNWKNSAEKVADGVKVKVSELENEFKTKLNDAIKNVGAKQEEHLKPLTTGLTEDSLNTANDAFKADLETINDLKTKANLDTEQTKTHQDLVDAIENPLKTAKETLGKNEKLGTNFLSESKTKFTEAKNEFDKKFGDDLKPNPNEETNATNQTGTQQNSGTPATNGADIGKKKDTRNIWQRWAPEFAGGQKKN